MSQVALFMASVLLAAPLLAGRGCLPVPVLAAAAAESPAGPPLPESPLTHARSTFLREHADNLVAWLPWGDAAFARAAAQKKPVLLSIGFASCHWCHVLARESFCDAEVAALINRDYVPVLVDREELPTVDAYYSAFVAAQCVEAAWPLLVFLAQDRRPIVGTSFLHRDALKHALERFSRRWADDPVGLANEGATTAARLIAPAPPVTAAGAAGVPELRAAALHAAEAAFDPIDAGFGPAPKFPNPLLLQLLLRPEASDEDRMRCSATIQHMADGAIHDILGGGFHRYTVDEAWRVPHFEKLLIDQAELAITFTRASRGTELIGAGALARECLEYATTRLRDASGACQAGEDADSPGHDPEAGGATSEGAYYRWTFAEIRDALAPLGSQAPAGLQALIAASGLHEDGNVPPLLDGDGALRGCNLLRASCTLTGTPEAGPSSDQKLFLRDPNLLKKRRSTWPAPQRDAQILVGWNGVVIQALAEYATPGESSPELAAAEGIAHSLQPAWDAAAGLAHTLGGSHGSATALDTAELIGGLLALHADDGDPAWLEWALALQQRLDADCWDAAGHRYRDASAGLGGVASVASGVDGEEPSATSAIALELVRLATITGDAGQQACLADFLATAARAAASRPLAQPGTHHGAQRPGCSRPRAGGRIMHGCPYPAAAGGGQGSPRRTCDGPGVGLPAGQ